MCWIFRSQFEKCSNIIAKYYNLDKKIKEGETKVKRLLYYYKVANKDAENSCEDMICIMSYSILRDIGVS
jgi:hypothetical protein